MSLSGRTVLMIDDNQGWLDLYRDALTKAAKNASFHLHTNETLEELVDLVEEMAADITLIDFYLAGGVNGNDVVSKLKQRGFNKKLIGFSTAPSVQEDFLEAGADEAITKESDPREPLIRLEAMQ